MTTAEYADRLSADLPSEAARLVVRDAVLLCEFVDFIADAVARQDRRQSIGAGRPSLRGIALAITLFLLSIRRAGDRVGRLAERLETTEKANDVQRQMLDAAARRPRDRDDLAQRLRDGRF